MRELNDTNDRPRSLVYILLRSSKKLIILAVVAGIASGASSAGLISVINSTVNNPSHVASWNSALYATLLLVVFLCGLGSESLLVRLAQQSIFDMRSHLSRQILASPFRKLEEIGAHRLFATLTDDVQNIALSFLVLPSIFINGAIVIGCLLYLGGLSLTMLFIGLGFMVFGIIGYQGLLVRAIRSLTQAREKEDSLFEHFRAITDGAKELKLNRVRCEQFLADEFQPTAKAFQDNNIRGLTQFAIATHWGQLLFFVLIGLLILLFQGGAQAPVLTRAVLTIVYLMGPLGAILSAVPMLGKADIAIKKINSLGLNQVEQAAEFPLKNSDLTHQSGTCIELKGIGYSYPGEKGEKFALEAIDLTVCSGECVFLVGGNGSGKSTLLKLLTGLYVPDVGEILINGEPVLDDVDRGNYRQLFSTVFSDFYLFQRLLNVDGMSATAHAQNYLNRLHLSDKVNIIDGSFSTTSLSQGQRKRLALLSAYLEGRPVIIFDEWAADQDPMFKDIFYTQLLPELKAQGKAVLITTHDDRYFHLADRIVKLDSGRLVKERYAPEQTFVTA